MKATNPLLAGHQNGDSLGKRMLESRRASGLTQAAAAKRIGISPGQLGRIERGSVGMVSDPHTRVCAGRVYGVSDVWLYAGRAAGARLVPEWYGAPKLSLAA